MTTDSLKADFIMAACAAPDSPPLDEALRESLAREFHVSAWHVEVVYREELRRLVTGARITTFLGLLTTRRVRARLER